jgi:hypothetical protein
MSIADTINAGLASLGLAAPTSGDKRVASDAAELGSADPNVDRTGEGESPIEPENLNPPNVPAVAPHAPPLVTAGPGYIPPGAPSVRRQVAPTQDLGVRTFALDVLAAGATPASIQVAPASSTPRRVTVTVIPAELAPTGQSAVFLSPDRRQDDTGALMSWDTAYVFVTGAPLHVVNLSADDAVRIAVVNEPLPLPCDCDK